MVINHKVRTGDESVVVQNGAQPGIMGSRMSGERFGLIMSIEIDHGDDRILGADHLADMSASGGIVTSPDVAGLDVAATTDTGAFEFAPVDEYGLEVAYQAAHKTLPFAPVIMDASQSRQVRFRLT